MLVSLIVFLRRRQVLEKMRITTTLSDTVRAGAVVNRCGDGDDGSIVGNSDCDGDDDNNDDELWWS